MEVRVLRYSYSLAIDGSGNPYIAGRTYSSNNIASSGAHQTTLGGSYDAFLVKFDSSWSTSVGNLLWRFEL